MPFPLIAHTAYESVLDIDPIALAEQGVRLVLADLDNTLAPYSAAEPSPEVRRWKDSLHRHGLQLLILSNSRKPTRVQKFARGLDVPFIGHAGKPRAASFRRAMEQQGCTPRETVMVGDQIFTDIWGARRAGVTPLLVRPIRLAGNPGRYLRYAAELPFRLLTPKDTCSQERKQH